MANIYRTVTIGANHTFYQLHKLIQNAFKFDDDHLFAFYMDGERWSGEAFYSADASQEPKVEEAKLGELDLVPDQGFLYLFDFCDQ